MGLFQISDSIRRAKLRRATTDRHLQSRRIEWTSGNHIDRLGNGPGITSSLSSRTLCDLCLPLKYLLRKIELRVKRWKFLSNSEIADGLGRITLNRPDKRNALRRDFIEQLCAAVSGPEIRRHVTRAGHASRRHCVLRRNGLESNAGSSQSSNGKREWQKDSEVYCDLLTELYSIEVPTVVALQGPVLAGGVGIVLACDIVIASDTAFLMLPEPVRGITAAMVTPLLIHRVGAGIAGHLLLSGERMSAQRGWQIGLCHDVVEANQLADRVESLTQSILTGSKSALSLTKLHLGRCSNDALVKQIQYSVQVSAEARESSDAREGLAAFLEKRKPAWQTS